VKMELVRTAFELYLVVMSQ